MLNVAKLVVVSSLAAALILLASVGGYKAYLSTQIGHANPAAASNPKPEPERVSPGVIVPTSSTEAN